MACPDDKTWGCSFAAVCSPGSSMGSFQGNDGEHGLAMIVIS